MDWFQVLTIVASTIGCCLYFRRETKAQLDKMEEHGRERDKENKDFHARMAVLEEKHLQFVKEQADRAREQAERLHEKFQQMMQEQSEIRTLMYQAILEKK